MRRSLSTHQLAGRWLAGAALAAAAACGAKQAAPEIPLGRSARVDSASAIAAAHALIGPQAKAALERGNAFFTKKAYADALIEYRAASAMAPQHAAPLYGIYMVARATNNAALADSALAGMRKRSGSMTGDPHTGVLPKGADPHAGVIPRGGS